jgi:uncharacterized protein
MPACPTCREEAAPHPDNRFAPFCSRRCRLADLGKWLDEDYRIADPDPHGSDEAGGTGGGAA